MVDIKLRMYRIERNLKKFNLYLSDKAYNESVNKRVYELFNMNDDVPIKLFEKLEQVNEYLILLNLGDDKMNKHKKLLTQLETYFGNVYGKTIVNTPAGRSIIDTDIDIENNDNDDVIKYTTNVVSKPIDDNTITIEMQDEDIMNFMETDARAEALDEIIADCGFNYDFATPSVMYLYEE